MTALESQLARIEAKLDRLLSIQAQPELSEDMAVLATQGPEGLKKLMQSKIKERRKR